jgi:hypothetical protein
MNFKFAPLAAAVTAVLGIGWLLASSGSTPPTAVPSSVNGIPVVEHVIYLSVDALRGDALQTILNTRPTQYPNFKRLRDGGASTFRARTDYGFTETIPNHSSMVTGRPVYEPGTTTQSGIIGHGQINNTGAGVTGVTSVIHKLGGNGAASTYKSSVFDVVHESGRPTAFFFSKDRIFFLVRSYDSTYGADSTGVPGVVNPARNKIDRASPSTGFPANASAVGDAFVTDANTNGLAAFTMLHFIDPDTSVHSITLTTTTPPAALSSYESAILACDTSLGKIFAWLDAHPAEKACTTIIVSGDHGGVGGANAHGDATRVENYTIPFFITGPGFAAGSNTYQYFTNRTDPVTVRSPDLLTTLPNPPIRNGDMANLATTLLGLPTVPGSYFKPLLINPDTTSIISITPTPGGSHEVKWPLSATGYRLETTTNLQTGPWTLVTTALTTTPDSNVHTVAPSAAKAFFRLKKI